MKYSIVTDIQDHDRAGVWKSRKMLGVQAKLMWMDSKILKDDMRETFTVPKSRLMAFRIVRCPFRSPVCPGAAHRPPAGLGVAALVRT